MLATIDDFDEIDIRVGQIIQAESFPEARKPAYKLLIDFGDEIGIKRSSAQITKKYQLNELIGKKVLGVVNFPPRQIGPVKSEVLTLGVSNVDGDVVLVAPDLDAPLGSRLF